MSSNYCKFYPAFANFVHFSIMSYFSDSLHDFLATVVGVECPPICR